MAFFYGSPKFADVPLHQLGPANNGGTFRSRTGYYGLSRDRRARRGLPADPLDVLSATGTGRATAA